MRRRVGRPRCAATSPPRACPLMCAAAASIGLFQRPGPSSAAVFRVASRRSRVGSPENGSSLARGGTPAPRGPFGCRCPRRESMQASSPREASPPPPPPLPPASSADAEPPVSCPPSTVQDGPWRRVAHRLRPTRGAGKLPGWAQTVAVAVATCHGSPPPLVAGGCTLGRASRRTAPDGPPTAAPRAGYYECDNAVKVGRPRSLDELAALIAVFPRVKASGELALLCRALRRGYQLAPGLSPAGGAWPHARARQQRRRPGARSSVPPPRRGPLLVEGAVLRRQRLPLHQRRHGWFVGMGREGGGSRGGGGPPALCAPARV